MWMDMCIYEITDILISKYWTEKILIQENMILNNINLLQHMILDTDLIMCVYNMHAYSNNVYFTPMCHILRGYKYFQVRRKNSLITFHAIWSIFKTQLSMK